MKRCTSRRSSDGEALARRGEAGEEREALQAGAQRLDGRYAGGERQQAAGEAGREGDARRQVAVDAGDARLHAGHRLQVGLLLAGGTSR